jgi:hypothetical protein
MNPDYNYSRIRGRVLTLSLPVEPVSQTVVSWQSGSKQTFTDQMGEFDLLLASAKDGWLFFSHPAYHSDSVYIDWPESNQFNTDISLNAVSVLDSLTIYSVVLNRFPSFQKEELFIKAYITDRDNDIDSVRAVISGDGRSFHLPFNTTDKSFQRELSIFDLGITGLEEIIGKPVQIFVRDIFSRNLSVGHNQLVRVIHDDVIFISPEDTTTGKRPTLTWQPFQTGFEFHYTIEIYTDEVAPQLVWMHERLAMEQTMYTVDQDLQDGNYFWVIWAIDDFGNRTRSKLAAFSVQGEI